MPFLPITLVCALLHAWIGWRIVPALATLPGWPATGWIFGTVLTASTLLIPLAFRLTRRADKTAPVVLVVWLGLLLMGLFSSLFVLTLLRDALLVLVWLALWLFWLAGREPVSLDAVLSLSAAAVPVLGLAATAWGFMSARRTARIVRVDVPISGLPAALHGFTVAQLSDIHVGPTIGQAYLRRIVARVNTLGADMVAITGDLVDGRVVDLATHVAPLSDLSSRHGTFFVTGNHEYYSGVQPWIDELRRLGMRVLLNQHVVLDHPSPDGGTGASVVIAGVSDFNAHQFDESHRSDPHAAIAGAPAHVHTRLLLAHQPRSAPAAASAGFHLQLSGHTHGGQIWPWNHFVQYQQPFTAGLDRLRGLWVYTHSGTGYWGPPKRFGVPSEITCVRLVMAD